MLESSVFLDASALLSWDFNVFNIEGSNPQSELAWNCFAVSSLVETLKLPVRQLQNVLIYVENNYSMKDYDTCLPYVSSDDHMYGGRILSSLASLKKGHNGSMSKGNPYHNNLHGADVLQAVMYFSLTYKEIGGDFTALDQFCLLFAGYIHDFNHPGLNTTFVVNDWPSSVISLLHGTESPLEKHHLARTFNLLRNNQEEYNFLKDFNDDDVMYFRKVVTECVLATDLAKTMSWLASAKVSFVDMKGEGKEEPSLSALDKKKRLDAAKLLKMQLAIKCGDVGHPTRPLELHLKWSSLICDEFFNQGDVEVRKGMKVSPLCDRNAPSGNYPQGQIGFINFVCKPVISLMSAMCSKGVDNVDQPWLSNMESNLKHWEGLLPPNK